MKAKLVVVGLASVLACALLAAPADAQTKKKRVAARTYDSTVVRFRDEDGRRRTRIIVQKRSYLNLGTQTFPNETRYNDGFWPFANTRSFDVIQNTPFSRGDQTLPGPFELSSPNNPGWR